MWIMHPLRLKVQKVGMLYLLTLMTSLTLTLRTSAAGCANVFTSNDTDLSHIREMMSGGPGYKEKYPHMITKEMKISKKVFSVILTDKQKANLEGEYIRSLRFKLCYVY